MSSVFDGLDYNDVLEMLRQDLQLNAQTDILRGTILATLVDQNGVSSFPQLVTPAKQQIAVGTTPINFPGSVNATDVVVTHGLGRVPVQISLTQLQGSSAGQLITYDATTLTTTQFTAQGRSTVAVSGTVTLGWLAIG